MVTACSEQIDVERTIREDRWVATMARVAVFGTGETQWGAEYYCGAVHRIAAFFGSDYPRLEIEQMPHGARDARRIEHWTDAIIARTETPAPC